MHSRVGPWTEAHEVYISQSELESRALSGQGPLVIYDIGMGIAANAAAAQSSLERIGGARPLWIESFERYPEAINQALSCGLVEKFPFLAPLQDALSSLMSSRTWLAPDGRIQWRLHTGDFLKLDLEPLPRADLIYFDFYAPAVCPELWGYRTFSKLQPKLNEQGLLITYASTKAVRTAMLLADFWVGEGVSTAMKHETTVAAISRAPLKNPIDRSWLARLARSEKPLPSDWPRSRYEEALAIIGRHPQFS